MKASAQDLEAVFRSHVPPLPLPGGVATQIKEQLSNNFECNFPLLRALCSPHLRARHWEAISTTVGIALDPGAGPTDPLKKDESSTSWFTLSLAVDMEVGKHVDKLTEIAGRAGEL